MTVTASETRRSYTGNGSSTAFAYGYKFFKNSDLIVYLVDNTGALVGGAPRTLGVHYNVTGAGSPSGGTVTFVTAPPSGYKVIIVNSPEAIQDKDYVNADDFPAESHEEALDRLTKLVQRIQDQLKRVASIPDISDATPPDPAAILQAAADTAAAATAGAASAAAAASSATAAASSASAASTSQTAAAASASAASTSASAASTSATNAASSASAASSSASSASTSATAAASSASAASTSATNAATSATNAATSATAAASSATAAASSATAAASSATLAADWASKTNGQVAATDYSAKAWAIGGTGVDNTASRGSAKDWATKLAATVDGTDYSAKYWAQQAAAAAGGATSFIGTWNAGTGSFPTATAKGSYYLVSGAGTVNGVAFDVGDQIFAIVNNPSTTTYANNWVKVEGSISGTEVTTALGYTPMRGSNNLSEVSTPATARSNIGAAASATTISAAGLATGGGDLSANRTITVTAATGTDVTTGTDNTKAVTSAALAAAGINLPATGLKALTIFTSSGTWNRAAGAKRALVWAIGGGGSLNPYSGSAGGQSNAGVLGPVANGGAAGTYNAARGADGTASGGDINVTGGAGINGYKALSALALFGLTYKGTGASNIYDLTTGADYSGGNGGLSFKNVDISAISTATITVGASGSGTYGSGGGSAPPYAQAGAVVIMEF